MDDNKTADDALEAERDSLYDTNKDKLPEDNDSPAAPAAPTSDAVATDTPSADSVNDENEAYETGEKPS